MPTRAAQCPPDLHRTHEDRGAGVAAYLAELLKLSPKELIATTVLLHKRLLVGTLTGAVDYRVPGDSDFIVFQMQGAWRSSLLATEAVINAAMAAPTPLDLQVARMSNCAVDLKDTDRPSLAIFPETAMNLAAITAPSGSPIFLPANAPLIVPGNHVLRANFTLQDATAAVVGNAADYGLILSGVLIPHRS